MTDQITRERVVEMVAAARAKGENPDLRGLDLSHLDLSELGLHGADMHGVDLYGVDLCGSDLTNAYMHGVDLSGASMNGADLRRANLVYADLSGANLSDANLHRTNLRCANLNGATLRCAYMRDANLTSANLTGAILYRADLSGAKMHGLRTDGLPSGDLTFIPTANGWRLTIGCWTGTTDELREMIAKDDGWPEAEGEQIIVRRPMLAAMAYVCDAYAAANPDALAEAKAAAAWWEEER